MDTPFAYAQDESRVRAILAFLSDPEKSRTCAATRKVETPDYCTVMDSEAVGKPAVPLHLWTAHQTLCTQNFTLSKNGRKSDFVEWKRRHLCGIGVGPLSASSVFNRWTSSSYFLYWKHVKTHVHVAHMPNCWSTYRAPMQGYWRRHKLYWTGTTNSCRTRHGMIIRRKV